MPFAHNPELHKIHEIRCTSEGNIDEIINELSNSYSQSFKDISKFEVIDTSSIVYDPIDYMWTNHIDWLWHLTKIQADLAWDITIGDPNVKIAVIDTDFDKTHPDLASEIFPHYDPYTLEEYDCIESGSLWDGHGTGVASFASAETTEPGAISLGQLASVGFNTKIIAYKTGNRQTNLTKALHASNVMNASVIVSCAGGSLYCSPDSNSGEELIVKEILDNGTVIVMPAGNGLGGAHCGNVNNYTAFYPFHPEYDERIIVVTSTDAEDYHYWLHPDGEENTHSHFPEVDICAPGYNIMSAEVTDCGDNEWPYYGSAGGTSFASPIVAGAVGLLKSIDPDLTPAQIQYIIKSTADPVADADDYPGLIGAGRLNIFNAAQMAVDFCDIIISGNEVWQEDREILCNLIVEDGAELNIEATVNFSQQSNVIVKRGGTLIVNGGTLTTSGDNFWKGIEVWGNSEAHQYTINGQCAQGQVILKNGAVIENAYTGVLLGKSDDQYNDFAGGIIQVEGNSSTEEYSANFINCFIGVSFRPYQNFNPFSLRLADNLSYFKHTLFEANNEYFWLAWYGYMVNLNRVNGINFDGCNFLNNNSPYGDGIYAYESGFVVSDYCASSSVPCDPLDIVPSTFTNFNCGIRVSNSGSKTVSIHDATLNHNSYGIKLTNVNNATIHSNEFNIAEASTADQEQCGSRASGYGIWMDNCTGFAIEENEFSKATGVTTGTYTGIRVAETNAVDEIYNNTFYDLTYSIYTQGKNWLGIQTYTGLAFYCNQNVNNANDFYVADEYESGIQSNQGSSTYPAGNTFSVNADYNFFNGIIGQTSNHTITYWHESGAGNQNPYIVSNVNPMSTTSTNACPSHSGGGEIIGYNEMTYGEKLIIEQEYASALNSLDNVQTLYNNLQDGGDTEGLVTDVETAWPDDTWVLRAELLGISPHLSKEVLMAASDKTEVLPDNIIFEILAANPDELREPDLLQYLEEKADPLPQYMIDILREVAAGTTYKTVLQQQMAQYSHAKSRAANTMLRSLLKDTISDYGLLRNWLDNLGGMRADEQIIETYLAEGNTADALTLAGLIQQTYELSGIAADRYSDYLDVLNLRIVLMQAGKTRWQLDQAGIALLETIANTNPSTAGAQARGWLEACYGYNFCECMNIADD